MWFLPIVTLAAYCLLAKPRGFKYMLTHFQIGQAHDREQFIKITLQVRVAYVDNR